VLGQNATVLLISDGLDRDAAVGLRDEVERLSQVLPSPDLAEPAVALLGLRAQVVGREGDAALRRRLPARCTISPASARSPTRCPTTRRRRAGATNGKAARARPENGARHERRNAGHPRHRRELARRGQARGARHRGHHLGPRPARSAASSRRRGRPLRRLGLRRLHRGRGGQGGGRRDREAPALLDFGVSNEQAWEVGLACGGKVQVFVERLDS
jgi:hypothetical protein